MKDRVEMAYSYARANGLVKTYGDFAKLLDVEPATLSRWLSGKQTPSEKAMRGINRACGDVFSVDWLLYGTLPMLKEKQGNTIVIRNDASGDSVRTGNITGNHNIVSTRSETDPAVVTTIQDYKRLLAEKELLLSEREKQIAELQKDKESLMQLLTNLTAK